MTLDLKDSRDLVDSMECKEPADQSVLQDPWDRQVYEVYKETRARRERMELLVLSGQAATLDHQDHQVLLEHKDQQDHLVHLVLRDHLEELEQQDQKV